MEDALGMENICAREFQSRAALDVRDEGPNCCILTDERKKVAQRECGATLASFGGFVSQARIESILNKPKL